MHNPNSNRSFILTGHCSSFSEALFSFFLSFRGAKQPTPPAGRPSSLTELEKQVEKREGEGEGGMDLSYFLHLFWAYSLLQNKDIFRKLPTEDLAVKRKSVDDYLAKYYCRIVGTARFRSLANVSGESSGKLLTTLYILRLMHLFTFVKIMKNNWKDSITSNYV